MKWRYVAILALVVFLADYACVKYNPNFAQTLESMLHMRSPNGTEPNATSPSKMEANLANPSQILLHVTAQAQNPDLYNGCEMTSLAMLLAAAGHPYDKITLANEIRKDPTPQVLNDDGSIQSWGDPNNGFVGDITGQDPGYGVYHGPVTDLLNRILPGKAVDLTGNSFAKVLDQVASGKPVMAWTTVDFTPTNNWVTWQGPNGPVRATFDEHVVLIVGYNDKQVFVNDPLDGTSAKPVDRKAFEASWKQMGQQAVSFAGSSV
jgi:uncharacterized protein YvpB